MDYFIYFNILDMLRKKSLVSLLLIASILVLSVSSCMKTKKPEEFEAEEQAQIDSYLAANPALAFDQKESGLYYLPLQSGTGPFAKENDTVYVKYTAKFLNGYIFDTNVGMTGDSLFFPLDKYMIRGFLEGITYLNKGGKAVLLIPSKLGYGANGMYPISGYTPLLFDVELIRIKPGPGK